MNASQKCVKAFRFVLGRLILSVSGMILMCLVGPLGLRAQQDAGAIIVAVTDQSSANVVDAEVTIVNTATNAAVKGKTNDTGFWTASR